MASTLAFIDQLQGANYSTLSSTDFGVGIVDPDSSGLTSAQISSLESSGKTLLAYLSIGMANNYRSYWQPSWNTSPPSFIVGPATSWPGAYYVAFWSPEWQQIVINQAVALAQKGYGGIDLDVVDVYLLSNLSAADGGITNARADMVKFIEAISVATKAVNPNFKIVQNNAQDLLTINPDDPASATNTAYLSYIDGVLTESTFYLPDNSKPSWSAFTLQYAAHAVAAGKTVFSIDYPSSPAAQQDYINQAIANGFVPYAATSDQTLSATIDPVNYQIPNLLPSTWHSAFVNDTLIAPPLNALTLDAPTYAGSALSGNWNLSGVATTATTLNIYDRTQTSASNPTGLVATVDVTAANGSWSTTGLLANSANSLSVAHDFYATYASASGGSGDYWLGTSGNDTFTFGSEQALLNGGVWGNGGNDTIALSAPVSLTDADFANVHLGGLALPSGDVTANSTGLALTLNGASAVTLGTNAANANITTVNAGNGNTSITDGNSGTLTVDASAMAPTATMTLSSGAGTEGFTVTDLTGSLDASAVKGAVTVTATGTAAQTITTGSGDDMITAGPSDTITGGAGNDTYDYTNGANSLYSTYDTITDFSVSGTDYFKIGHTVRWRNFHSLTLDNASGNLSDDLSALLTSYNFASQGADLVTITGASDAGSYVVINNAGVPGFNGGLDAVIKLTAGAANVHASSFIA